MAGPLLVTNRPSFSIGITKASGDRESGTAAHVRCGNSAQFRPSAGSSGVARRFGEDNELSGSARPAVVDGQGGTGRAGEAGPPDRPDPGPGWLPLIPAVVTLVFCLYQIQRPSFTRDESATLAAVHRSFPQLVRMLGTVDVVHGLYYALIWVVVRIGGSGEFAVRLPSAVALAVAAAVVTALGRRLVSLWAGLAAGLVFAVLPSVSWFAETAREGALVAALGTVASYCLVRVAPGGGRPAALDDRLRRDAGCPRAGQPVRPADRGRPRGHPGLPAPALPGRTGDWCWAG